MKEYKINEIFYSIQGEGHRAGEAAVFVRFSGCNLRCPFCDTKHEEGRMMTAEEICREVGRFPAKLVVLTGGEPSMFVDEDLCRALHAAGREIAMETNGTRRIECGVDWVTCSPKFEFEDEERARVRLERMDELKVVYTGKNNMDLYEGMVADWYCLQPCDMGDEEKNRDILRSTLEYIMENPKWRLSLQIHKVVGVR